MKPRLDRFAVVTATTNVDRAWPCITSWWDRGAYQWPLWRIDNDPPIGTVPAFAEGVRQALAQGAEIVCALHDDLLIEEDDWDARVIQHFETFPLCGLAGFGGAPALGDVDIYRKPYDPMQLARAGFVSNMREAEAHGGRTTAVQPVACLDGFSLIGRAAFLKGQNRTRTIPRPKVVRVWDQLEQWGMVHHAYDAAVSCLAKRLGWEAWLIPVACHHFGGQTAVADPAYQAWAREQRPDGDLGFWQSAHGLVYEHFKDVLPIRV